MEVNCSCIPLSPHYRRPVIITATTLAVGLILSGIGLYLLKISFPVIAYATFGAGGVVGIGGLIYFAVTLCRKKPLSPSSEPALPSPKPLSPSPSPKPVPPPPKPSEEEEEELKKYNRYLYEPDLPKLLNFCLEKGYAQQFLRENGKKAGDYVLSKQSKSEFYVFYLDEQLKIHKEEIKDPNVWSGNNVDSPVYEKLRRPIFPSYKQNVDPLAVHHTLMGFHYLAFLKKIDGGGDVNLSGIGSIHRFFNWLRNSPKEKKYRFDPYHLFRISGHIFGLQGKYTYTYQGANMGVETPCTVKFEGFDSDTGRHVIMQDILNYLPHSKLDKDVCEKIELVCRNAYVVNGKENPSADELMKQLENDTPITVMTGWDGHAVNLTMTRDYLIYINKGDGSEGKPGMHLYKITNKVTKETLEQLLSDNKKEFFPINQQKSQLVKLLGLKYQRTFASKYQKVGCCVFASNFPSFKAAMILLGVNDQKAEKEYKACKNSAKLYWLENVFCLIDKQGEDDKLKTELYFFLLYLTIKLKAKKAGYGSLSSCENEILNRISKKTEALNESKEHPYLIELLTHLKHFAHSNFANLNMHHQEILKEAYSEYWTIYRSRLAKESSGASTYNGV